MKRTLSLALAAVVTLATAAGCAGLGGQSDEEQIMARIDTFSTSLVEQDMDGIMSLLHDDFYHPEAGGKDQVRLLLEMAMAQGYLDGGEVRTDDMEIRIAEDGRTATAGPIDLSGPPGAIAVIIEMEKGDDGVWYLTSGDQY